MGDAGVIICESEGTGNNLTAGRDRPLRGGPGRNHLTFQPGKIFDFDFLDVCLSTEHNSERALICNMN